MLAICLERAQKLDTNIESHWSEEGSSIETRWLELDGHYLQ